MAGGTSTATTVGGSSDGQRDYTPALTALTSLFFMWGFLTCLNDMIIPHLKAVFELNYAQAMLIQFCFFTEYFIMSLSSGWLVERLGYKNGIIIGLLAAAIAGVMFCPAAGQRRLFWYSLPSSQPVTYPCGRSCLSDYSIRSCSRRFSRWQLKDLANIPVRDLEFSVWPLSVERLSPLCRDYLQTALEYRLHFSGRFSAMPTLCSTGQRGTCPSSLGIETGEYRRFGSKCAHLGHT
jgi:hypothetical protein